MCIRDRGRIAAKVGKNVIIQAINEAVNGSLLQEFEAQKGKLITGVVKRIEGNKTIYLEIGKYELPLNVREDVYKRQTRTCTVLYCPFL